MIRRGLRWFVAPFDWPLLTFCCLLLLISIVALSSAAPARLPTQGISLLVGIILMRIVCILTPQQLMKISIPIFIGALAMLIGVAFFGDVSKGARRWLNLGFIRVQPSELMKIALPLMLAWFYHQSEHAIELRNHFVASLIILIPVGLIMHQPDLGTALLVLATGMFAIFLAGLLGQMIAVAVIGGLCSLPFLWPYLHDYQRERLLILFNPELDPQGKGFHIIQSMIAIGSGGLTGKGWGQGTQSQLDFIPEHHTDFIVAVFSEEFGLIGVLVLIFLYALLIGRGLTIAARAPTTYTRLLAGSITLGIFTHVFVNMGMVSGILPVVGVPLPFLSYGGTSLISFLVAIGVLMVIENNPKLVQT